MIFPHNGERWGEFRQRQPHSVLLPLWLDCIAILRGARGPALQIVGPVTQWSISVRYGELDAHGSGLRGEAGTLCAIRQEPIDTDAPGAFVLRAFATGQPWEDRSREVMRMAWDLAHADPTEPGGLYVERLRRGAWEADLADLAARLDSVGSIGLS